MVEQCHALLFIEGTQIRNWIIPWYHNNGQYESISIYSELELFTVTEFHRKKEIVFHGPSADPDI